MQTNPFRAEEATLYFTYCTCLLVYDYLLYITYVTSTFVTKINILKYNYIENLSLNDTHRSDVHFMFFTNDVDVYDFP